LSRIWDLTFLVEFWAFRAVEPYPTSANDPGEAELTDIVLRNPAIMRAEQRKSCGKKSQRRKPWEILTPFSDIDSVPSRDPENSNS
jgi:hypothetical protein